MSVVRDCLESLHPVSLHQVKSDQTLNSKHSTYMQPWKYILTLLWLKIESLPVVMWRQSICQQGCNGLPFPTTGITGDIIPVYDPPCPSTTHFISCVTKIAAYIVIWDPKIWNSLFISVFIIYPSKLWPLLWKLVKMGKSTTFYLLTMEISHWEADTNIMIILDVFQ